MAPCSIATGPDATASGPAGHLQHVQPLPRNVPAFAIAGSLSRAAPLHGGKPRGDGLVPVASALGWHDDPDMAIGIDPARQWIAYGTGHLDLLCSSLVYEQIKGWLGGASDASLALPARAMRRSP